MGDESSHFPLSTAFISGATEIDWIIVTFLLCSFLSRSYGPGCLSSLIAGGGLAPSITAGMFRDPSQSSLVSVCLAANGSHRQWMESHICHHSPTIRWWDPKEGVIFVRKLVFWWKCCFFFFCCFIVWMDSTDCNAAGASVVAKLGGRMESPFLCLILWPFPVGKGANVWVAFLCFTCTFVCNTSLSMAVDHELDPVPITE